jgi:hypothetical protein
LRWRTANRRRKLVYILAALNPCIRLICQTPKAKKVEVELDWSPYDTVDLMRPLMQSILNGPRKPVEPFVWNHKNDAIPRADHMSEMKFVPTSFGVVPPPFPERCPPLRRIVGFDMAMRDGVEVSAMVTGTVKDGVVHLDAKTFDLVPIKGVIVADEFHGTLSICPPPGEEEGAVCRRDGCTGVIELKNTSGEACQCWRSAPCWPCMSTVPACPACGWESEPPE